MLWYAENIRPVLISPGKYDVTKLPEIGLIDVPSIWSFDDVALPKQSFRITPSQ